MVVEADSVAGQPNSRRRLLLLAVLLLGLLALSSYYGIHERADVDSVREFIQSSGVYGWVMYFAVFAGGEFLHVPGLVFVAAGILIYGKAVGFGIAYLGAVISVVFSFVLVRQIGGRPFDGVRNLWLQKGLSHLDERPIRTVLLLRLVFWMAPALNYALALTGIRFSHYVIGSAIALLPVIATATLLFDWLMTLL